MADRFYVENYSELTEKEKIKLRKKYVCADCGEWVSYWMEFITDKGIVNSGRTYIACHHHKANQHEGVAREFIPPDERNNLARRESMDTSLVSVNQALAERNLPTTGTMNESQALQVCRVYWPKAPDNNIQAAAYLCRDYGLHPGANHIYLIPYAIKDRDNNVTGYRWEMIWSIAAKRLVTMRVKGQYSYIDDTPRIMSEAEQIKIFGAVDKQKIRAITKLQNMQGMEVSGHGEIGTGASLKGGDKGNSLLNMAMVRSESRALDRLPGNMSLPAMEAIDAEYAETPDGRQVDVTSGKIIETELTDKRGEFEKEGRDILAEVIETAKSNPPAEAKAKPPVKQAPPEPPTETTGQVLHPIDEEAPPEVEEEEKAPPESPAQVSPIDLDWLKEQLGILQGKKLQGWTNAAVIGKLQVYTGKNCSKVSEAVSYLTQEQAGRFVADINETVSMA